MLMGLWCQGMTAPCVGHPCKISASDGRSFMRLVYRRITAVGLLHLSMFGDPSIFLYVAGLTFLTIASMNPIDWWKCSEDIWCLKSEFSHAKHLEFFTIEGWSIVSHDDSWYAFGRKQISAGISASFGGESMWQERWMETWRNNLQWLKISVLNHLGRNPYLFWSMVQLGLRVDVRFLPTSLHCQCMSHTIWCNPSHRLPFLASKRTFLLGIGIDLLLHDSCAGQPK